MQERIGKSCMHCTHIHYTLLTQGKNKSTKEINQYHEKHTKTHLRVPVFSVGFMRVYNSVYVEDGRDNFDWLKHS